MGRISTSFLTRKVRRLLEIKQLAQGPRRPEDLDPKETKLSVKTITLSFSEAH